MMGKSSSPTIELEAQNLLQDGADETSKFEIPLYGRRNTSHRCSAPFLITIALLLVTNSVWYWGYHHASSQVGKEPTPYYGAPATTRIAFDHDWIGLEGDSDGHRYREDRWEGLLPKEAGSVALSKDFAKQHHLGNGTPVKDSEDKMHYLMAGYHQLHCAYILRDALYYLNGTIQWHHGGDFDWDHVLHCVDAVRQGLACFMDPTIIPLESKWPGVPNGQKHTCTNRDAMFRFGEENGHALPEYE